MENTASRAHPANTAEINSVQPRLLERLMVRWFEQIERGQLTIEFPSGHRRVFARDEARPQALLKIHNLRLILRMLFAGDLGLSEGYLKGEWETPDLAALLTVGALNLDALSDALQSGWVSKMQGRMRHAMRANTRRGSRRNIAAHYDLGNAFYKPWLDRTMTYSSALFDDFNEDLSVAQHRKYARLAEALEIQSGDQVLEIGCGWGGFAEYATREFGCKIIGLTLSTEQANYARTRVTNAGLGDQVEIRLQDYRDVEGKFDKIVSIEMFEAVGVENWPVYFDVIRRRLTPGGRAAIQTITIEDERFDAYRSTPDFIQHYIFPGGALPSPSIFTESAAKAGMAVSDNYFFGPSYAETLRRWKEGFLAAWPEIRELGFDDRFHRMWLYYLCYCEAGFDTGKIDVAQFTIEHR
jgi:cyclopropane-fatty-acyl-phospholipid synthase